MRSPQKKEAIEVLGAVPGKKMTTMATGELLLCTNQLEWGLDVVAVGISFPRAGASIFLDV